MQSRLALVHMSGVKKLLPPVFASPAETCGAFVVVLAVRAKRFAVHDPPQGRHPGCPPLRLRPVYVCYLVGTGPGQGTSVYLFKRQRSGVRAHSHISDFTHEVCIYIKHLSSPDAWICSVLTFELSFLSNCAFKSISAVL